MIKGIFFSLLFIIVALAVGSGLTAVFFNTSISGDIGRVVSGADGGAGVVTADEVARLPAPVQRYLAWAGVVGKAVPGVVRVTQGGHLRGAADDPWMDFQADETYSTDPAAFVWRAYFPKPSQPLVFGRDEYFDGNASIAMRALGVITVADEHGPPLLAAGLMRYLDEMVWFPAAFVGPNVDWRAIDDNSASVTLSSRGMTATGTLTFDAQGRPVDFTAMRYNTSTAKEEAWETPFTAYGSFNGVNVPTAGSGIWKLAGGDLTYIELAVTAVTYDAPAG